VQTGENSTVPLCRNSFNHGGRDNTDVTVQAAAAAETANKA